MRVTWLCSRRVEGEIEGYYTEKQIESEKDRVKKRIAVHDAPADKTEC